MRVRDNFETCLTRIRARILDGDYAGALRECDLAEETFGPNWRIDFNRGYSYTMLERFDASQVALNRVKGHNISCRDPYCLSQGVYILLFQNASEAGWNAEALHHIDALLSVAPEDISGFWLRGTVLQNLWQQTGENAYLQRAIYDRRTAYALIKNLPDDKFYRLKIMRDLALNSAADLEIERRCQDTYQMHRLMQISPIRGARTVNQGPDAVDTDAFLDGFTLFVPAAAVHIYIGFTLVSIYFETEAVEDYAVEVVDILDEIESLAEQHGDTEILVDVLVLASAAYFEIYTFREDVNYLDAAKSKHAALLRLSDTDPLNITDETREYIEDLGTEIRNVTSDA